MEKEDVSSASPGISGRLLILRFASLQAQPAVNRRSPTGRSWAAGESCSRNLGEAKLNRHIQRQEKQRSNRRESRLTEDQEENALSVQGRKQGHRGIPRQTKAGNVCSYVVWYSRTKRGNISCPLLVMHPGGDSVNSYGAS